MKRKENEAFVKKVYVNVTEDPCRRGRPVVRWKKYINKELFIEGDGLSKQVGSVWIERGGSYSAIPWERSWRERGIRDYR